MAYTLAQVRGYVQAHERRAALLQRQAMVQHMDAARLSRIPEPADYLEARNVVLQPPPDPAQQQLRDAEQLARNLAAVGIQLIH